MAHLGSGRVGQRLSIEAARSGHRALFKGSQQVAHRLVIAHSGHKLGAMLQEPRPGIVHQHIEVYSVHCCQAPRLPEGVSLYLTYSRDILSA